MNSSLSLTLLCNAIWRVGCPRPTKCHTLSNKSIQLDFSLITLHFSLTMARRHNLPSHYNWILHSSLFTLHLTLLSDMNNFKIQPYTKKELALLYFPSADPHVAVNRLMMWIKRCQELHHTLVEQGYKKNVKWLSAREVGMIVRWLGEP